MDTHKRPTKKQMVLNLLQANGKVRTSEFLANGCGSRFGARIQELRREGYVIESKALRQGEHQYHLIRDDRGSVRSSNVDTTWSETFQHTQAPVGSRPSYMDQED